MMQPNELEEMSEKELPNGETISMYYYQGKYVVDCFDVDGESRWHLEFDKEADALKEYNRWN